jgi:hypothetical protein
MHRGLLDLHQDVDCQLQCPLTLTNLSSILQVRWTLVHSPRLWLAVLTQEVPFERPPDDYVHSYFSPFYC